MAEQDRQAGQAAFLAFLHTNGVRYAYRPDARPLVQAELTVTLSSEHAARAEATARKRNGENRRAKQGDGAIIESLEADVQGAHGELAVHLATGLPWDGEFMPHDLWLGYRERGHDLGPLEVRSTKWSQGGLIIHRCDVDGSPFVLVVNSHPHYTILGYCFGHEGKRAEWFSERGPRPAFYVPQYMLRPAREILHLDTATSPATFEITLIDGSTCAVEVITGHRRYAPIDYAEFGFARPTRVFVVAQRLADGGARLVGWRPRHELERASDDEVFGWAAFDALRPMEELTHYAAGRQYV